MPLTCPQTPLSGSRLRRSKLASSCSEVWLRPCHSFKIKKGGLAALRAAFTTCHSRVNLYLKGRDSLLTRVPYMNTDSVIYMVAEGESPLPRGRFLRPFKDDLSGDIIVDFVAGGPENYVKRLERGRNIPFHVFFKTYYRDQSAKFNQQS